MTEEVVGAEQSERVLVAANLAEVLTVSVEIERTSPARGATVSSFQLGDGRVVQERAGPA